jgi:hypothetical protein
MVPPAERGLLDRLVAPWPLLAGILSAFVACCVAGRLVSHRPRYQNFARFHRHISPEALHYPTACQLKAQTEAGLAANQVLVVIGGNSILHGVGQREEELWTKKLQALLGERYRVANLAMRGGGCIEFGGVAAEMVAADHPKMIFVTIPGINASNADPSFGLYRYLFWDALYKGLLPDDAEHQAWIARARNGQASNPAFPELQWQMKLDGLLYSRDLWTTLAYERFATVWTPLVAGSTLKPRRKYPDVETGHDAPFAQRYAAAADEANMALVRSVIPAGEAALQGPRPALVASLEDGLPPLTRPRTLLVFCKESPYYLARLTPEERERYHTVFARAVRVTAEAGISSLLAGDGWTVDDFCDRCHLSEAGGARLAALVAPRIDAMARQLGYVEEEERP